MKFKSYTKTNQKKFIEVEYYCRKMENKQKILFVTQKTCMAMRKCTGFTGQRQTAETKQREYEHQCFDKKKHLLNKLLHCHYHHQYNFTPKSINNVLSGMSFMQV